MNTVKGCWIHHSPRSDHWSKNRAEGWGNTPECPVRKNACSYQWSHTYNTHVHCQMTTVGPGHGLYGNRISQSIVEDSPPWMYYSGRRQRYHEDLKCVYMSVNHTYKNATLVVDGSTYCEGFWQNMFRYCWKDRTTIKDQSLFLTRNIGETTL